MLWTAFLDACVLYPWSTADLLLRLTEKYIYRVLWSEDVLTELRRSMIDEAGASPEQALHRTEEMQAAFPEACVTGYAALIPAMQNHEKDRHVLAAAVVGRADVIVTDNVRHFPEAVCNGYDIEVQTVDTFLTHQLSLYPDIVAETFIDQVVSLRSPCTIAESLRRAESRLPQFVAALRSNPLIRAR